MREEIIKMAREAGWDEHHCQFDARIERFFHMAQAAEREACAKLADSMDPLQDGEIGRAIRARGAT